MTRALAPEQGPTTLTGMSRRSSPASRRRTRIALVLLLVLFVNLPLAHSSWTRWRIEASGTEVSTTVVSTDVLTPGDDARYWVTFRYDEDVDPSQEAYPVEVDREIFEVAERSGELEVRHLEGSPAAYTVDGEVRRPYGLIVTLVSDAVLLALVLVVWRRGGRARRPYLRMVAVEDVRPCPPGALLERVEGTLYVVRGEVSAVEEDEIVLDLGDRDVHVVLDGHANPVGGRQPAEVRGVMTD